MDQQYPPPPPTPGINVSSSPHLPQRQRPLPAQPPSIATNLVRTLGGASSQTPLSGTSVGTVTPFSLTPNSPAALHSRASGYSAPPPSAISPRTMEPYDPRQWSNRGQVSGAQMVFQQRASALAAGTRDATGMEALMPSPPPPYSPDAAPRTGGGGGGSARNSIIVENTAFTASPLQVQTSAAPSQGPTPPVPMSPAFPPPPPQSSSKLRERSSSGHRNFFSLAGFRKSTTNYELQASQTVHVPDFVEGKPPAAKRAASTGQLHTYGATEASSQGPPSRTGTPISSWQPGMPLPGPPPGPPPPSGPRTQSLNRYNDSSSRSNSVGSENSIEIPTHRKAAASVSNLGPIPPTPADWVEPTSIPYHQPLRIDTGSGEGVARSRKSARGDGGPQGIRERRSRSRAAREGAELTSADAEGSTPNDFVRGTSDGSIKRRREHMRNISGYAEPMAEKQSQSPSFSQTNPSSTNSKSNVLTPPYTPAISNSKDESLTRLLADSTNDRPISQALYQPVEPSAMPAPLNPSRPPSSGSAKTSARLDPFLLQALERHRAFIDREATASSDEERLELFANFMVHESRLRRDRYSGAYNAMAGDIVDLTRDMWRSYAQNSKRSVTPSTSMSSFDPTTATAYGNMPSSASSYEEYTPLTEAGSAMESGEAMERSDSRAWGEAFKPSLSPIPSMNVSTKADEESSRGRAPSRWWEKSNSGSNSIGNPERIEKSQREKKYMGVNPATLQDNEHVSARNSWHGGSTPGPSTAGFSAGSNEYPPEKVGWHENDDLQTPMQTPIRPRKVSTPGVEPLDVSRLVTLPPPYPRHYPAVKNKHPQLGELRNEYRSLADLTRVKEIRDAYWNQDWNIQRQQEESSIERRKSLRSSIQQKIAEGTISFHEAAQAESDFDAGEAERGKANARSNFNVFESNLAHPLNNFLTERLEKANLCIDQLRAELDSQTEVSDPNHAQEEGDEQPERLEKLTLLKWVFETREQLHKEMYDLHGDRSAKYAEVILTPYRIAKQQAKIDEANAFFTKDNHERQINFAKASLKRFEELQQIMESNVSRGVEDQLSAFWDIAPGLLEVIQHIPSNISGLDVRIPDAEYDENPAYNEHPLQYLYSLLSHAQKSAYQFIESQTNLLCLLHEVRTARMKSSLRLLEIQKTAANPNDEWVRADMEQTRQVQDEQLTEDLKEKVGEVERQWNEALGEGLEDCKGRVKAFLEQSGGWEEGLEG